jgi:hypothetical protein
VWAKKRYPFATDGTVKQLSCAYLERIAFSKFKKLEAFSTELGIEMSAQSGPYRPHPGKSKEERPLKRPCSAVLAVLSCKSAVQRQQLHTNTKDESDPNVAQGDQLFS